MSGADIVCDASTIVPENFFGLIRSCLWLTTRADFACAVDVVRNGGSANVGGSVEGPSPLKGESGRDEQITLTKANRLSRVRTVVSGMSDMSVDLITRGFICPVTD